MIPHDQAAKIPAAATPDALPYARWSELGADLVVLGTVTSGADGLSVALRVVGVRGDMAKRQALGKTYHGGGCTVKNPRYCAHYISDDFHKTVLNIDGVAQTRLAFSSDRSSEVSPGRVANNAAQEIYISDYDGWNPQRVTVNRGLNISPAWSPDGHYLAYASFATGFPDVYVRPVYEVGKLTRPAAGNETVQNTMPAWSPDGQKLAFTSSRDGRMQVYTVNRDGSGLRRLTGSSGANLAPAWSPTGNQIAFVSDRGGDAQLYLMGSDGTGVTHLDCGYSHCDHPSWSGAINKIAYTCGTNASGYGVCLLDVASRQIVNLTDGQPGSNEQPTFAPNGRHIVFDTTRWGKKQLAMLDLKGTVTRRITNEGNNTYPAWSNGPR
jgi:TolB protein